MLSGTTSSTPNQWVHVAMSVDKSTQKVKFYENGALINEISDADINMNDDISGTVSNRGQIILTLENGSERVYNLTIDTVTDMDPEKTPWVLVTNYIHKGDTNPPLSVRTESTGFPVLPADGSLDFVNVNIKGQVIDGSTEPSTWGHAGTDLFNRVCAALGSPDGEYNTNGLEMRFVGKSSDHTRVMHFKSHWEDMFKHFRKNDKLESKTDWPSSTYTLYGAARNGVSSEQLHSTYLPGTANRIFDEAFDDSSMTEFPFYHAGPKAGLWSIQARGRRWEVDNYPNDARNSTYHQIWVRGNRTNTRLNWVNTRAFSKQHMLVGSSLMTPNRFKGMLNDVNVFEGALVDEQVSSVYVASQSTSSPVLPADEWTHVAVNHNAHTKRLDVYLNGAKAGTYHNYNASVKNSAYPITVGKNFVGEVAEPVVMERPLLDKEIGLLTADNLDSVLPVLDVSFPVTAPMQVSIVANGAAGVDDLVMTHPATFGVGHTVNAKALVFDGVKQAAVTIGSSYVFNEMRLHAKVSLVGAASSSAQSLLKTDGGFDWHVDGTGKLAFAITGGDTYVSSAALPSQTYATVSVFVNRFNSLVELTVDGEVTRHEGLTFDVPSQRTITMGAGLNGLISEMQVGLGTYHVREVDYVTPKVLASFSFDESDGTDVVDTSGMNNNGTIAGGAVRKYGTYDAQSKGLVLNAAANQYVTVDGAVYQHYDMNTLTLSSWIRTHTDGATSDKKGVLLKEGVFEWYLDGTGVAKFYDLHSYETVSSGTAVVNDDAWTHVAVVVDEYANLVTFFRNGVEVASVTPTIAIRLAKTTSNLVIGRGFTGELDNVILRAGKLDVANTPNLYSVPDNNYNPPKITANEWNHVAGVFNKQTNMVSMYLNGEYIGCYMNYLKRFSDIGANTNDITIGTLGDGSTFFDGIMDDVRIYKSSMNEDQIKELYALYNLPTRLFDADDLFESIEFKDGEVTVENVNLRLPGTLISGQTITYYMFAMSTARLIGNSDMLNFVKSIDSIPSTFYHTTTMTTNGNVQTSVWNPATLPDVIDATNFNQATDPTYALRAFVYLIARDAENNIDYFNVEVPRTFPEVQLAVTAVINTDNTIVVTRGKPQSVNRYFVFAFRGMPDRDVVLHFAKTKVVPFVPNTAGGAVHSVDGHDVFAYKVGNVIPTSTNYLLPTGIVLTNAFASAIDTTTTPVAVTQTELITTYMVGIDVNGNYHVVSTDPYYFQPTNGPSASAKQSNGTGTSINTKKVYLNVQLFDDRTYTIQRILPPYDSMDCWVTERRQADAAVASWTFTFSEASRLIQISHGGGTTDGFTELAVGYENMHFQPNHWSTPETRESYKDFNAGETVTIEAGGDTFFVTVGNRPDSTMPIVTRLTDDDFVHTGVLATGGVQDRPLEVVYKFDKPSNDGIEFYEVSMNAGTTVPVKRVTMFATKTLEYSEENIVAFYDSYVQSITQSNAQAIVHIASYDLDAGFADMSALDSTTLTHAYTDLFGTTEAVSEDNKYIVYFVVHDINDTITVKSKGYLKEYVLRDVDYSTVELVADSSGNLNHPVAVSVNDSSTHMGAQMISTDGMWMVTASSEYYYDGVYTSVRPGYFNIFKNMSSEVEAPSYEHYCHILIPAEITITQGEGDDMITIPEQSGTTIYRSGVSRSSITHDGTYVLVNGSNWAAVFKHDEANKTYTLYANLNRQMTQVVGYHGNTNHPYYHKCGSGTISDNGEFVMLYGTSDTNANREDITCGVWRNTGTDFELLQGDGFKWAFKHSNYISFGMDMSGDGKTIVVCSGGRLNNDWQNGQYGYIDMGFRVYRLNPVTNVYDMVQYARYNNWNNSVIETEENTNHDFLAQTGGGSTIGLRMPSSGWVQGIPSTVTMSYDGNNFLISGGRARDGQSAMCALYVYNPNTKRFEFNSNFTNGDSQYGLGYTNNRTPYGNNQPCHYPQATCISAYGDYVFTTGHNYNTVFYVFKRKPDGFYEKVYQIQTTNWQGGQNSVLNMASFGGNDNSGFIGAGNYIYMASGSTRRIVSPIQPHVSRNERSTIPLKINDVLTTTMATTIDSYTDASARKTPWTLVLNYMHKAGTNPDLSARDATGSMPVLPEDGSLDFRKVDINGTVENGSTYDAASWGHTGNDLFDKVCKALGSESDNANGLEVRFVGKSGGNDRLVHFKSDFNELIKDYRYGNVAQGVYRLNENTRFTDFTLLEEHTAYLPDQDIVAMTEGTGDAAMTDGLFVSITSGNYHFYIGNGGRWESDDTSSGAANNTYHQIWVRANGAPYVNSTRAFNGTDAIDVTGTVFSNAADITTVYPPVAFTMGVDLTDLVKTRDFFERNVTPLSGVSAAQYATTAFPAQSVGVAYDRLALPLASGATAEVSVKETNWGSITANTPTFELSPDQITGVTVSGKYGRKCAISADGKTALVTAPINQTSGEAYLWTYDGSAWNMVANLSKSTGVSGYYGAACALSGDGKTALVTGYYDTTRGCAFIWQFDGTNWGVADGAGGFEPNYDLSSGARGQYGYSCALSGDGKTALIGASVDRKGGSAFLWRFTGDNWVMTGLSNPNANTVKDSEYGYSCALSGDGRTALVAGPNNNNTSIGNAYIWEFNPVTNEWGMFDWSNTFIADEPHDLTASAYNFSSAGRYGQACGLSLDGKTAVVSGWLSATAGGAWVWQYKDGEWGMFESDGSFTPKMAHNLSSGQMSGYTTAYYGLSCSISGDGRTVIIGDDTDSTDAGNLWLWEYDASTYAWGAFDAASAFTANAPHNLSMTSGAKGDYARSCSMSANGQYVMVSGANESANGQGGIWIWEATVSGERKPLTIGGEEYAVAEAVSSADYQVVMAVEDANGNFELGGQMISRTMYRQWPPPDATVTKGTLGSTSEWSLSNASYGNGSYKATVSPGVHPGHNTYGVFDNSQDGYFWHANANTYAGILTLHLPEPIALTGYSLMHRRHYDKEHSPKNWTVDGSNDNSTWTTVDTQTDQGTSYDNLKPRTYRFSNSTAYKYYRLNVTSTNGGNYLMVAEWRMYESFTGPSIYGPSASVAPMLTDFERQFGTGWQLIKSIDGGSSWFSRDKLQGYDGDEFLFSTGDFSRWLIADHSQVGATSNTSHTRTIKRSSISETPYQATWYDSSNNWNGIQNQETIVALESWGTSGANKTVMYVEGGVHTTSIHTSGMRVYTRTAPSS